MKTLLLLTLVCGCAYGETGQEITYGHTKGPGNDPDAGVDNLGSDNSSDNALGVGCHWEAVMENGQPTSFYVLCPKFEPSWKNLSDPPPDPLKK